MLPTSHPYQSSVLLIISLKQYTPSTDAEIQALVTWTDDNFSEVELELFPKRVKVTEAVLQELEKGLPQLYTTLKVAIRKWTIRELN
jgi:hypothetical protein